MNPRRSFSRSTAATRALTAAAIVGLAGCNLIDLPGSDIVTDDTRLPESDSSLVSTTVAPDRVTYTYAAPPKVGQLAPGQVIVGQTDGGYLRKVQSVETVGDTLVVHTEDAALTDAVANQKINVSVSPDKLRSKLVLLDVSGRVLVDTVVKGVPLKITIVRGTAQLEPAMDFELDIAKRHLKHLAVTMKGTLTLNFDVKVEAGGALALAQEIDLSGPTASLYTYPFVFPLPTPIGPLPVAGTLEVDAFAGFAATITAMGTLTTGLEGTSSFGVRAAWDDGTWTVENEPTFDGMIHRPQLQTLLASDARVYVRPEVRARFYGVAGPSASVTPSLKAAITVAPPAPPTVKLDGCIAGKVGFDAKLFGVELVDLAHDFPDACRALPLL
jgi:hypothetical protein